jgi:SAM-dependent methyltransferase/uncharacterized protein YbaR (Trm112 family)
MTAGLVCPLAKSPLERMSLAAAEQAVGGPLQPAPRTGAAKPIGATDEVLLRADRAGAYPILADGIPVLLGPEILVPAGSTLTFDLADPLYAEAYGEMEHYDAQAAEQGERMAVGQLPPGFAELLALPAGDRVAAFPARWELWVDAEYDSLSQHDCYTALGALPGRTVAQLGGTGLNAVKFLLAGAATAYLVAPMAGELRYGRDLAERCGVAEGLVVVAAIAEQLPFPDGAFDAVYAPGCLHHMQTTAAGPEIARTLAAGGVFAAAEPWRARLYAIGTRIMGRREAGAQCSPLTPERVAPLHDAFANVTVTHHGALTRYPTLALAKLGWFLPIRFLYRLFTVDDALTRRFPRLRRQGSSVSVVARRAGRRPQAA